MLLNNSKQQLNLNQSTQKCNVFKQDNSDFQGPYPQSSREQASCSIVSQCNSSGQQQPSKGSCINYVQINFEQKQNTSSSSSANLIKQNVNDNSKSISNDDKMDDFNLSYYIQGQNIIIGNLNESSQNSSTSEMIYQLKENSQVNLSNKIQNFDDERSTVPLQSNSSQNNGQASSINNQNFNLNGEFVQQAKQQEDPILINNKKNQRKPIINNSQEENQNKLKDYNNPNQQNKNINLKTASKPKSGFIKKGKEESQLVHRSTQVINISKDEYNTMKETIAKLQRELQQNGHLQSRSHNVQPARIGPVQNEHEINQARVPYEQLRLMYLRQREKTDKLKKELRNLYSIYYPDKKWNNSQRAQRPSQKRK